MIPLQSHCVPTQMGEVDYKTLIFSTQFKQDTVHRSDSPHLYFHCSVSTKMGGTTVGYEILIPFTLLLTTGMGGKLKTLSSCTVLPHTSWTFWAGLQLCTTYINIKQKMLWLLYRDEK